MHSRILKSIIRWACVYLTPSLGRSPFPWGHRCSSLSPYPISFTFSCNLRFIIPLFYWIASFYVCISNKVVFRLNTLLNFMWIIQIMLCIILQLFVLLKVISLSSLHVGIVSYNLFSVLSQISFATIYLQILLINACHSTR